MILNQVIVTETVVEPHAHIANVYQMILPKGSLKECVCQGDV